MNHPSIPKTSLDVTSANHGILAVWRTIEKFTMLSPELCIPFSLPPLHPTRQGPSPSASPWWASRPRHVSFRGIMPPRGRGPGLDMSVWISPPTPRNADAVRDACRLCHSDPRPGRSSRGQGPSPGTPLSGAGGVGRDDGPPGDAGPARAGREGPLGGTGGILGGSE